MVKTDESFRSKDRTVLQALRKEFEIGQSLLSDSLLGMVNKKTYSFCCWLDFACNDLRPFKFVEDYNPHKCTFTRANRT